MRRALLTLSLVGSILASLTGCDSPRAAWKHPPKRYHAVVSLSPGTTEVLVGILLVQNMAGRTSADDYPAGMVKGIPIVASTKPDYEKLASIHPDLIVYDATLYNDQDVAKLKGLGADMYAVNPNSWADYRRQLFELGSLLGAETKVSDYVDRVTIELNNASAKLPNPAPKVAIVLAGPNGNDMIDGTDSFLADLVHLCGGVPVGPKGNLFVKLSPEELVQDNPDVIITSGRATDLTDVQSMLKDPRFQTVAAIKNKHVQVVLPDVLLRRGERVDTLVAKGIFPAVAGASPAK